MHHTIGNDTICISLAVFAEMDVGTDCPDDEGNKDSGSIVYFLQKQGTACGSTLSDYDIFVMNGYPKDKCCRHI